jgi:hypothetical protein
MILADTVSTVTLGDTIIIIFLTLLLGIAATGMFLFIRRLKTTTDRIVKEPPDVSLRQANSFARAIDDILNVLRIELNCTDIYIARFHNGGSFANGERMKKFSVVYGKASMAQKELVRWTMYDKFTSHWPEVFDQLYAAGEYYCPELENSRDSNFKRDMQKFEFKSIYLYLITQPDVERTPEAFIAINYRDYHTPISHKEERDKVMGEVPKLLALMNLVPFIRKQHEKID